MDANRTRTRFRFSLRSLLAVTAVIATLIGVGPWLLNYLRFGTNWPPQLAELVDNVSSDLQRGIGTPQVLWIQSILDQQYGCRFTCTPEAFRAICAANHFASITRDNVNTRFFRQESDWWNPDPLADAEFACSRNRPYFFLMYDKAKGIVYGEYYDRF